MLPTTTGARLIRTTIIALITGTVHGATIHITIPGAGITIPPGRGTGTGDLRGRGAGAGVRHGPGLHRGAGDLHGAGAATILRHRLTAHRGPTVRRAIRVPLTALHAPRTTVVRPIQEAHLARATIPAHLRVRRTPQVHARDVAPDRATTVRPTTTPIRVLPTTATATPAPPTAVPLPGRRTTITTPTAPHVLPTTITRGPHIARAPAVDAAQADTPVAAEVAAVEHQAVVAVTNPRYFVTYTF